MYFVATSTQGTPTSGGHPVTRSLDEIRRELVCPDPLATLGDDRGERDLACVHALERRVPTRDLLLAQARPGQLAAQAVPSLLRADLIGACLPRRVGVVLAVGVAVARREPRVACRVLLGLSQQILSAAEQDSIKAVI